VHEARPIERPDDAVNVTVETENNRLRVRRRLSARILSNSKLSQDVSSTVAPSLEVDFVV